MNGNDEIYTVGCQSTGSIPLQSKVTKGDMLSKLVTVCMDFLSTIKELFLLHLKRSSKDSESLYTICKCKRDLRCHVLQGYPLH